MYSAPYSGFPNAVPGNAGSGPTFDGAAPPQQNAHMQPGQSPNQPQMMYGNQQIPMGTQGQYSGGNPASMMAAAGPAAMMQNPGMPHMTPNGQSKPSSLSFPCYVLFASKVPCHPYPFLVLPVFSFALHVSI